MHQMHPVFKLDQLCRDTAIDLPRTFSKNDLEYSNLAVCLLANNAFVVVY